MTLNDIAVGNDARITAVGGEGALRLRFLDMGLIPGTPIHVKKEAPLGDPIQVTLRGYSLTLRRADASLIEVTEVKRCDVCACR